MAYVQIVMESDSGHVPTVMVWDIGMYHVGHVMVQVYFNKDVTIIGAIIEAIIEAIIGAIIGVIIVEICLGGVHGHKVVKKIKKEKGVLSVEKLAEKKEKKGKKEQKGRKREEEKLERNDGNTEGKEIPDGNNYITI